MNVNANSKVALGSVLGAVTETANAFGATLKTVNDGISMANNFVARHRSMQELKSKLIVADYEQELLTTMSDNIAERQRRVREKCTDAQFKQDYDAAKSYLEGILHPKDA